MQLPELKKDRADIAWLWKRTLFLTAHGSHAYGTNLPTSDHDYKGFAVPPEPYFHGYAKRFEQAEFKGDPDMTVYDIRKFFKLAADCNPSIIEVLFTDPSDYQIVTPLGQMVLDRRNWFLSTKARHTFSGYAISQLKKIKTHYKWINNPPLAAPTREEYGLPERTVIPADQLKTAQSMIRKQLDSWNVPIDELDDAARIAVQERFVEALALIETGYRAQAVSSLMEHLDSMQNRPAMTPEVVAGMKNQETGFGMAIEVIQTMPGANLEKIAGNLLGFDTNFLELLDKERHYRSRMEEWRSYQTWLATRNPARSELERKWGYDTKHGMHLVRLMRMGVEILEGKGVLVKRPDAQELLAIRHGLWKYEDLLDWAAKQELRYEELYRTSILPKVPPHASLDNLLCDVVDLGLDTLETR